MKKVYYCVLTLCIYLLIQSTATYVVVHENKAFFAPYLDEKAGKAFFITSPYIEDRDKIATYNTLDKLSREFELSLFFQSFDFNHALDTPFTEKTILFFCSTGKSSRLEQLPFLLTPSLDSYTHSSQLFTSLSGTDTEHRLNAPSRNYHYVLGRVPLYKGSLQKGLLFIMDAEEATVEEFLKKLRAETGKEFVKRDTDHLPFVQKKSSTELYKEVIGVSLSGRRLLLLGTVGISMSLVYLNRKKRWSILRLLGYSIADLFMVMARELILPTLMISSIAFIPFCLILGLNTISFTITAKMFLPILSIFILFQIIILFVFSLDQRLISPLQTLNRKKNHRVLLVFALLYKAVAIWMIFPVLTFNLLRVGDMMDRHRFMKESQKIYQDVWLLNASGADTNLNMIDTDGNPIDFQRTESLPWLKAFYDTIRDKYPVIYSKGKNPSTEEHHAYGLFLVNGNFVRLFELKDKEGKKLLPDNEEKMILSSADRYELINDFFQTGAGKEEFLLQSSEAFSKQRFNMKEDFPKIEVRVVAKNSKIRTFVDEFTSYTPKGWIESFSLGVNSLYTPDNLESLRFIGMSEADRKNLLQDVSHLPYTDQLKWEPYKTYQERIELNRANEKKEALFDFASTIFSIFFLSLFLYYTAYDWMAQRWAVRYLLGMNYIYTSLPLLGFLVAVNLLTFLFSHFFTPEMNLVGLNLKILAMFSVIDILLYFSVHLLYENNTLKNLMIRE